MKYLFTILTFITFAGSARAAFFTNSPDADAFVRSNAPTLNYGKAGALNVSGINAVNGSGITNGAFDSFVRFNTAAMVANLNSLFGSNNWVISRARLQTTEIGSPANTLFNRGKGALEIRWIANDNWAEGTGTPTSPTTDGICYNNEATLLNPSTDASLGAFTNAGVNFTNFFSLALPAVFANDIAAGGEVTLFLTAIDANIGFTVDSRDFGTVSAWPYLIVSAVPQPGISEVNLSGTNVVLSATNGAAGGTYYVLGSTNAAWPLSQWTPVATTVLTANGAFTITVTNAVNSSSPPQQFFILQTQ
jgi:archaellin